MVRRSIQISLAVLLGALVTGCGIRPVQFAGTPDEKCSAIRTRVAIDPPPYTNKDVLLALDEQREIETVDPVAAKIIGSYRDEWKRAKTIHAGDPVAPDAISPSMLFLSGGSQDGAFGAGLMSAWAEARAGAGRPPKLPRFRVVTGISTGALQSTFAFLNETGMIVDRYSIEHESELLHPFGKGGLKGGSKLQQLSAAATLIRKGSIAELQPLREQLRVLIDDTLLKRVAKEAADGRVLLVGAVEMDSGDAYAFDLTKAATTYVETNDSTMRDCYIEALLASSSVPMAALPVFIDGRMYIDGGARFGVLSDHLAAIYETAVPFIAKDDPKNLFIIINGTLEAKRVCHLKDCANAPVPTPAPGVTPEHSRWSFDGLAFRSLSILINQSYRSSVYWSSGEAKKRGFDPHLALIDAKALAAFEATLEFPPDSKATNSCAAWKTRDETLDAPLEFHPRFMRCEIAYGAARPEATTWAGME